MASCFSLSPSLSLSRPIDRKWFAGISNYPIVRKLMDGSCSSAQYYRFRFNSSFYSKGMKTLAEPVLSPPLPTQNPSSSPSPWLMLPPAFDVDGSGATTRSYKFYTLADNKIVTLTTGKSSKEREEVPWSPMWFRGSSHGWLASFCPRSCRLFLYNPISRRHINLPSLADLPSFPPTDFPTAYKVILTCSPDDDGPNCRAVMIYNNNHGLAFCCPGFSNEWTRIGDHHWFDEKKGKSFAMGYIDCVYSTRHKALFSLASNGVLDSWDLRDPQSPRVVRIADVSETRVCLGYPRTKKEKKMRLTKGSLEHLVVAGKDLLVVTQHVGDAFEFDGLYFDANDPDQDEDDFYRGLLPVTVDFDVYRYEPEDGELKYVTSLGGWAIFVGFSSDAVALRAAEFPELNPNSIYFTDGMEDVLIDNYPTGGHDIGVFNYENKTVSPYYYPCDTNNMRKTFPAPMWFFPSQ
ncbi:hypothetical protein STAS_12050 [Striga asiatica]|uniref:KIB1-4 beta-propeller domain-containing protein n=1 Tax=Striga asiatica TaxID=4170 RepID=A0A5A7PSA4_STRAF|nr:hypothetical protein STAS_12050 [Striga asiatica]